MEKHALVSRKKKYATATLLLIVAQYVIEKAGEMIIATGGTDHISATIFVWTKGIVSLALVGSAIMWAVTWFQIRKMNKIVEE